MSKERDFREYVKKYHGDAALDDKNEVKHDTIVAGLLGGIDPKKLQVLDEPRIRALLSERVGALEEKAHGTFRDEQSGQRRNAVPESVTKHHNRLVDELYHKLFPTDRDGPLD